jgi:hypothetical protein
MISSIMQLGQELLINEQYITRSWPGEPQDYKVWQDHATVSWPTVSWR